MPSDYYSEYLSDSESNKTDDTQKQLFLDNKKKFEIKKLDKNLSELITDENEKR